MPSQTSCPAKLHAAWRNVFSLQLYAFRSLKRAHISKSKNNHQMDHWFIAFLGLFYSSCLAFSLILTHTSHSNVDADYTADTRSMIGWILFNGFFCFCQSICHSKIYGYLSDFETKILLILEIYFGLSVANRDISWKLNSKSTRRSIIVQCYDLKKKLFLLLLLPTAVLNKTDYYGDSCHRNHNCPCNLISILKAV